MIMKTILCTVLFAAASTFSFAQVNVSTVVDSVDFKFTDDLLFDAAGNLYCADYSGDKVFKRSPNGDLSVLVSGLNTPNGLAFDGQGALFICDNVGNRIYKVDVNGNFLDTIVVNYPSGIIKDAISDTMIFTTYGAQSSLKKLSPDGNVFDFISGTPLNGPVGLEYCGGQLYVANFNDRKIFRVEQDNLTFVAQLPGSGNLGFIACLNSYLFATAFNQHKIYKIDPLLETVEAYAGGIAGQLDGPLDLALFSSPNGITFNSAGDTMYISQYPSGKLRMITGYSLGLGNKLSFDKVSLRPNPAQRHVQITVQEDLIPCTVRILGMDGKVLELFDMWKNEQNVDVSFLQSGVYHLQIDSGKRGVYHSRLLKQ